jgi:hypothetical protein
MLQILLECKSKKSMIIKSQKKIFYKYKTTLLINLIIYLLIKMPKMYNKIFSNKLKIIGIPKIIKIYFKRINKIKVTKIK